MRQKAAKLERYLGAFTEVHEGEGGTVILLMLHLFVLLTAYLVIKTVREPLILMGGGANVKSYAAAGQALLLLLVVPIYGFFASKVNRIKLINWATLFFISNLVVFYLLARFGMQIGVFFFLWVGIFNLLVVAQFWSFANDIYTHEQGERLFAIVAFGGSLGAIVGPAVAGWMFHPLGPYRLMLVAAILLGIAAVIANIVNGREKCRSQSAARSEEIEKPLGKEGGFRLVMRQRYLLCIGVLMVVANLVNTTGEFILGKNVIDQARQSLAREEQRVAAASVLGGLTTPQREKITQEFIGKFYGKFFFWVSLSQAVIQLFLVSRIIKYLGISGALFFLPAIALGSYSLIAFAPVLSYIRFAKIAENSTDYSLQNTARHSLFLPTSREVKYKAKAAIDTFFVRIGDVLSAGVVFIGSYFLFNTQAFAIINVAMVSFWLLVAAVIGQHYKKLTVAEG
jgi:ATP:ADP antiporter, AAA family